MSKYFLLNSISPYLPVKPKKGSIIGGDFFHFPLVHFSPKRDGWHVGKVNLAAVKSFHAKVFFFLISPKCIKIFNTFEN